jgi:dTDP-4-amino-4,6-dideoxygalactose transaminase
MQFIDLAAQQARIKDKIDTRIQNVLSHGTYIMGPEVHELETQLADFCGAKHCVSCANGTDALVLALMAMGVGKGDAVIVPSFTFAASAEAPCLVGATPIFAEIDPDTYNIDPASIERCVQVAKVAGLVPKVVIAVDLFGLPADYPAIMHVTHAHNMKLIGDSAQGWGGTIDGRMTGSFGDITTTSFFPAKPLGCYGDGGALFTDDDDMATLLDSLRVHGKGSEKYDNIRIGTNSRLDTLQAAILLEKLAIYADELDTARLHNHFKTPHIPDKYRSIWAQYTLQSNDRDKITSGLKAAGIPSVVYYPRPLHTQSAYSCYPIDQNGLSLSEQIAKRVFSLPMHPYLSEVDQNKVIAELLALV